MKSFRENIPFLFIFLSAILLRIVPLFSYQFTLDEWSGLDRTRFDCFADLIEKGVIIDAHPALIQTVLFVLVKCFGFTDWIIKTPFLLCSFGLILYAYKICINNFSKQSGLVASAILSYSLLFVYYAPIARMYIPGAFFSMALLYYFMEIFFRKEEKMSNYIFMGLFALLSALNQHINALFALTVCVSGLLVMRKEQTKMFVLTCVAAVLLYLPHLGITLYQLGIGGIGFDQGGWLPEPEPLALMRFIRVLLGTGRSFWILFSLLIFCMVVNKTWKPNKVQAWLLLLFLTNYLIIYFYSVFRAPVFQYSVMIFSSVSFVIFFASFFKIKNQILFHTILAILIGILLYKTYVKKDYLHQCVQNIFEYQFDQTQKNRKAGFLATYPVFFDADTLMRKVCFERGHYSWPCIMTKDSAANSLRHFTRFIDTVQSWNIVLASSDPLHQAIVKDKFNFLVSSKITQGLNYKIYSCRDSTSVKDENELHVSALNSPGDFVYDKIPSYTIDSITEYPLAMRCPLNKISEKEGQVVLASGKIRSIGKTPTSLQLCISITDSQNNEPYYFTSTKASDFVAKDSCIQFYAQAFMGTDYYRIREKAVITIFFWNSGKEKFRILSLGSKTIKWWEKKWEMWE